MLIIWNEKFILFLWPLALFQKLVKRWWGISKPYLSFYVKFWYCKYISTLMVISQFVSVFVILRYLFFSLDSLNHLEKILKSTKIRCFRLDEGNSWRKWNESILHLYSAVEQVSFGISLFTILYSTLYFQTFWNSNWLLWTQLYFLLGT